MASITLKPGREKSLRRQHPWIFSGAIAEVEAGTSAGETVEVYAADGEWLARGAYSPQSQITVRIWTYSAEESITPEFFQHRLQRAIQARARVFADSSSNAYRMVNAESDGLPGVIVDQYAEFLVCQFLSAGAEHWKQAIVAQLNHLIPNAGIYERSDADVRQKEGLPPCVGVLSGQMPPEFVEIRESNLRFLVDIRAGQKTGFYLDQRDNRATVADYAKNAEALNCFAYTGGFGVYALHAGASRVTNIESSAVSLEIAKRHFEMNGLDMNNVELVTGDVFQMLRKYRDARRTFDLIVLDPPKFAESRSQIDSASRGYKDINLLAFKLLRPGGVLFTCSCSGLMTPDLFQKIVADAALDAQREAQILRRLMQAADHPTLLSFPEGAYLKGLICQVW